MFEGDPQPKFTIWEQKSKEKSFTTSKIELLSHTGTHIDAPSHLIPKAAAISEISLEQLIGEALVIEVLPNGDLATHSDPHGKIILLKTTESHHLAQGVFRSKFLTPNAFEIKKLINAKIKSLGIDTLSIDPLEDLEVINHPLLLKAGIPIIEGLDFEKIPPGEYFCVCLPLKLQGLDGAPARGVLISWND